MTDVAISSFPTQAFSNAGAGGSTRLGAGYRLYTYVSGSFTTLAPTYATGDGDVLNPNPLVADASGRFGAIFLEQGSRYNAALTLPNGTTVLQTWEEVEGNIGADYIDNAVSGLLDGYLPLTGGTVTGPLTVASLTVQGNTTTNALTTQAITANGVITANDGLNMSNEPITNLPLPTVGTQAANKAYVDTSIGAAVVPGVPTGSVFYLAAVTLPSGYLVCSGAAVSRTTFAALFAAISTTYGAGDGSTTFNLPDLRGVFIRGLDVGRGLDPSRDLGTFQNDQVQYHKHNSAWGEAGEGPFGRSNTLGRVGSNSTDHDNYWWWTNDGRNSDSDGTVNPVGTVGDETRPVNVALNAVIKT